MLNIDKKYIIFIVIYTKIVILSEFKTVKFCVGLKDAQDDSIISTSSEMKNIRFLVFGEYNYAWNFRKI